MAPDLAKGDTNARFLPIFESGRQGVWGAGDCREGRCVTSEHDVSVACRSCEKGRDERLCGALIGAEWHVALARLRDGWYGRRNSIADVGTRTAWCCWLRTGVGRPGLIHWKTGLGRGIHGRTKQEREPHPDQYLIAEQQTHITDRKRKYGKQA